MRLKPAMPMDPRMPHLRSAFQPAQPPTPPEAAALGRPISGRLTTGQALDRAVFLPVEDLPALGIDGLDRIEARAAPARLEEAVHDLEAAVAGAEALPLTRVSAADAGLERRLLLLLGGIGAVTIALALISVASATAALLNERRAEIALLAALGYSGRRLAGVVAAELAAAALAAAGAGALAGELLAAALARRLFESSGAAVTASGPLAAVAAAVVVVGAGLWVTLQRVGRLDAAAVLRGD